MARLRRRIEGRQDNDRRIDHQRSTKQGGTCPVTHDDFLRARRGLFVAVGRASGRLEPSVWPELSGGATSANAVQSTPKARASACTVAHVGSRSPSSSLETPK